MHQVAMPSIWLLFSQRPFQNSSVEVFLMGMPSKAFKVSQKKAKNMRTSVVSTTTTSAAGGTGIVVVQWVANTVGAGMPGKALPLLKYIVIVAICVVIKEPRSTSSSSCYQWPRYCISKQLISFAESPADNNNKNEQNCDLFEENHHSAAVKDLTKAEQKRK